MNLEEVSIIIPSAKTEIHTLESLKHKNEVIISRKAGLGKARNHGAKTSRGKLLIFLDDDLTVNPTLFTFLLSLKHGEFAMAKHSGFPCSRVCAIYRDDFFHIGMFDDSIRFVGEDMDFYFRAVEKGLTFRLVPRSLFSHKSHIATRHANNRVTLATTFEYSKILVKHFPKSKKYMLKHLYLSLINKRLFGFAIKTFSLAFWILRVGVRRM